jgi:hypothetical protein
MYVVRPLNPHFHGDIRRRNVLTGSQNYTATTINNMQTSISFLDVFTPAPYAALWFCQN